MNSYEVLIVGAGHGGAQAAISLRQLGFEGLIAIIGDEPDPPYERPPLSKEYFSGEKSYERLLIRPADFWPDRGIDMYLEQSVVLVDPVARRVETDRGKSFGYGKLIWAAGGTPRRLTLPGSELSGIQTVRTRVDADAMKAAAAEAANIVVIGGGYIGLEAAAVLSKAGKKVVLLEGLDRVLARVAGEQLSRFFEDAHRAFQVDVRLGVSVEKFVGDDRVSGVRLAGGEIVAGDLIIVGIGIEPAVEPLAAAGAECPNGVLVDDSCRTTLPDIYAIGDCAAHVNRFAGGTTIRLESVQNANDMAKVTANSILGRTAAYDSVPWFWSKQFDLKLQTVGLSIDHDAVVVRGSLKSRSFSCIYLKQGQIIALDCVNAVKDYVEGRKLVERNAQIDPAVLANAAIPLREMAN